MVWRRIPALAATVLIPGAAIAQAADVVPSETIIERLSAPPAPLTRSLRPANGAAAEGRPCDASAGPDRGKAGTGSAGALSRNLYRIEAPAIELDVQFEIGSSILLPEGRRQLDQLAAAITDTRLAGSKFVVAGHTDGRGTAALNDELSCKRALAVRDYLGSAHAILASRLVPVGFGASKLKNSADPLADVNRRVEIRKTDN